MLKTLSLAASRSAARNTHILPVFSYSIRHFSKNVTDQGKFLRSRTALITGSTSGIGLGVAHQLAAAGANIILNGFGDASLIDNLKKEFADNYQVQVSYSPANMLKSSEIEQMCLDGIKQFGSVDILVNNAGIQYVEQVHKFPKQKWDDIISINLSAAFHSIASVLPGMQAQKWGRIINVASVHGLVGSAGKSAYVASKHGIVGLTKVVALEQANNGITANAVCPGWVLTPLVQKQIDDRAAASGHTEAATVTALIGEKQPMHRFSTPEGLGGLVVFLCTDHAQTMTGTTLTMDGGWTAQ